MWAATVLFIAFFVSMAVSEYNRNKQHRLAYEAYCNACMKANQKPETIQQFEDEEYEDA